MHGILSSINEWVIISSFSVNSLHSELYILVANSLVCGSSNMHTIHEILFPENQFLTNLKILSLKISQYYTAVSDV